MSPKCIVNPKDSRGVGRSGSIWLRTIHIDSGSGKGLPSDILIKAFSQKVGKNCPLQLLMSLPDAEEFSDALRAKIKDVKEGSHD